jgi:hypothetical protein
MKLKAAPSLSEVNLSRDLEETIEGQRANHNGMTSLGREGNVCEIFGLDRIQVPEEQSVIE